MHVVEVQVPFFFRDILGPQICHFVVSYHFHFVYLGMHGWFLILIHSAETCNHPQPIPTYLTMQMNTLVKHIFFVGGYLFLGLPRLESRFSTYLK